MLNSTSNRRSRAIKRQRVQSIKTAAVYAAVIAITVIAIPAAIAVGIVMGSIL